jgi:hypothetical protein
MVTRQFGLHFKCFENAGECNPCSSLISAVNPDVFSQSNLLKNPNSSEPRALKKFGKGR